MEMRKAKTNWQKVVDYLVGRGGGGTPSGDDILVAYLALLHAFDSTKAIALAKGLSRELATPDVSKAYLIAAIKGEVNLLIYELFQSVKNLDILLVEANVQKLMAIGHFSGKDMAFGLLLAAESLLN